MEEALKILAKAHKQYQKKSIAFIKKTGKKYYIPDYIQLFDSADLIKKLGGEERDREDEYSEWSIILDGVKFLSLKKKEK